MNMSTQSAEAYAKGVKDGTIDDSIEEIYFRSRNSKLL